jgi:hypothetical protein
MTNDKQQIAVWLLATSGNRDPHSSVAIPRRIPLSQLASH